MLPARGSTVQGEGPGAGAMTPIRSIHRAEIHTTRTWRVVMPDGRGRGSRERRPRALRARSRPMYRHGWADVWPGGGPRVRQAGRCHQRAVLATLGERRRGRVLSGPSLRRYAADEAVAEHDARALPEEPVTALCPRSPERASDDCRGTVPRPEGVPTRASSEGRTGQFAKWAAITLRTSGAASDPPVPSGM